MGDPAGACAHVRDHLAPGGTLMLIEPFANDDLADNLNPVGAAYYGFSTLLCTPSSLSQDVGTALGAQAGEARLREIVTSAGFTTLRRVAETPFNIVLEAKAESMKFAQIIEFRTEPDRRVQRQPRCLDDQHRRASHPASRRPGKDRDAETPTC